MGVVISIVVEVVMDRCDCECRFGCDWVVVMTVCGSDC